MRNVLTACVGVALLLSITGSAQNAKRTTTFEPLPRDLEIQLAISALPPHLRDDATVYVLNPSRGFEIARKGTNGFHALVARTGDDSFRGTWPLKAYRDDLLYPISFDEAGARAPMRVFFDAAEMQAKGKPPEELKKLIQERYKTGYYKAPDRAGVSYMLAPILRTYVSPDVNDNVATSIVPHIMHYAPNVSSSEVGAATPTLEQLHYYSEHGHWPDTLELSPFLRQTVKTQKSANGMKMPLNGGLSHGFVSTAVHEGVQAGRAPAAGDGGVSCRGGTRF